MPLPVICQGEMGGTPDSNRKQKAAAYAAAVNKGGPQGQLRPCVKHSKSRSTSAVQDVCWSWPRNDHGIANGYPCASACLRRFSTLCPVSFSSGQISAGDVANSPTTPG